MKQLFLPIIFLLLVGCAATNNDKERFETETEEQYMSPLPGLAPASSLKIVKMTKLSFAQSEYTKKPCNTSAFLSRFVGEEYNTDKGKIRIDNIVNVVVKQTMVTGYDKFNFPRSKEYACIYSGYGVEYDFSDIEMVTIKKNKTKKKKTYSDDDEDDDDE